MEFYNKLKEKTIYFLDLLWNKIKLLFSKIKNIKIGKENWGWILVGILIGVIVIILGAFRLREVEVIGNYYYSKEDIEKMILTGPLGKNTLFLKYKYMGPQRELLPLIDEVEIEIQNPYTITINVYEKEMIGYIFANDEYLLIDKNGFLVEKSSVPIQGLMAIEGVEVTDARLYKEVKSSQPNQIQLAKQINEMLKSHAISPDKLVFDVQKMTLIYQEVRIELGSQDYLQDKLAVLASIFDKIKGQAGTLHMEEFTNITKTVTFEKVVKEVPVEDGEQTQE